MIIRATPNKKDIQALKAVLRSNFAQRANYVLLSRLIANSHLLLTCRNNNWEAHFFSYTKHLHKSNLSTADIEELLDLVQKDAQSRQPFAGWVEIAQPRKFANSILGMQVDQAFSLSPQNPVDADETATVYGDDDEPPVIDKLNDLLDIKSKKGGQKKYLQEVISVLKENEPVLKKDETELINLLWNFSDFLQDAAEVGPAEFDALVKQIRRICANYAGIRTDEINEAIASLEEEIDDILTESE